MDPTAAPIDLQLNGTTYQAYPLRDIDHETMNKWVRREYISRVKELIVGDAALQRAALAMVATMEWPSDEGLKVAVTVDGIHKLATLMCRNQKIPKDLINSAEALDAVFEAYVELHSVDDDVKSESTGGGDSTSPK